MNAVNVFLTRMKLGLNYIKIKKVTKGSLNQAKTGLNLN